ncbi:MAG: ABC transporter ATP-binding protein [candidate division SR1 bacterium]|nr:ABC transporter ATP-binding protein [candidate division SR1 bacterium]
MGNEHQQKKKPQTVGTRRVISYFWKQTMGRKWPFISAILGMIIASLASLILPIYYTKIIDIVQTSTASRTELVPVLLGILWIMAIIEIVSIGGWRMVGFGMVSLEPKVMRRIFQQCFAYINRHSYKFFTNNFSGALVKKINKLAGSYENVVDNFVFNIVRLIIFLPFIVIVVGQKDITIGLVFMLFILIFGVFQYLFFRRNTSYEIRSNIQDSKTTGELADTITNNFNILTFASVPREISRFDKVIKEREHLLSVKWMRAEWMFFGSTVLIFVFEIGAIYLAIKARGNGTISAGVIILIQVYIFKVFEQLFNVRQIFKQMNKAIGESAEMLEILDAPHEIVDHTIAQLHVDAGRVEFTNVQFGYVDGKPIFNGLNLDIKPGEKVAIVGQSGSGKTTLVKLLFRFFDIQGGNIFVDGQDIGQVTQDSLRGNLSMVPQDTVLFHRTIKENIAYGDPDATEEEIIAAAKMARCHEFITKMKHGYETLVGERGIKLSGGERQRVAIARAILENKRILVLDEATSSLDSQSEQLIQEAMDEVMKNKTTIVIAHRLSTIMKMDKIVVMDKGQIIEKGSHKELLAKENGTYKKLRDIQSGGFIDSQPNNSDK